jgi:hypothetical protein
MVGYRSAETTGHSAKRADIRQNEEQARLRGTKVITVPKT